MTQALRADHDCLPAALSARSGESARVTRRLLRLFHLPRLPRLMNLIALIALSTLLAACSSLPATTPLGARPERALIDTFNLDGRLSVRQEDAGRVRHQAVHVYWQHSPTSDDILLSGPLGQGLARLQRDAGGARLQLADQRQFFADDWQTLARQLFDIELPWSSLAQWIIALPVASMPSMPPAAADQAAVDAAGRLQWQQIGDWRIHYLRYESPAAQALPTLLEMRQTSAGTQVTEVKLSIDDWQLPTFVLDDAGSAHEATTQSFHFQ